MRQVLAILLLSTAALTAPAVAEETVPPATPSTAAPTTPELSTPEPSIPEPSTAEPTTATPPPPTPPPAATSAPDRSLTGSALQALDQRLEAYDQFRTLFEAARFDEALPLAQRVVELSETAGNREKELPIAYNNLAATQYQLSDYAAAETNYKKSLALLEENQGMSSRRMIVPLAGLGAVYAALDQHELAVKQFDRALAVSRRSEGLFNLAQLPMIDKVADSRFALGDYGGVERDYFYALRIAEQHYGYDDVRTAPPAMKLASFYESLKQFAAARGLYLRARDVSLKNNAGYTPMAVRSLLGIGRTHRLQFTMQPETMDSQQPARDEVTGEIVGRVYRESRVPPPAADRAGLKAIEQALVLLRAAPDASRALLDETLTELGDWYQATARASIAADFYAEASTIYAAEVDTGTGNPLSAPRMIFYRPPLASTRGIGIVTGEVIIHQTTFSFDVNETGDTQNVAVVTTDMAEGQLAQSRRALERAIYSPRFEDGKPVATQGVQFTSRWYEQRKTETPSTSS
ncbi:MAG: tetratricopeptide repeat protein [Steroidobacteraceae bacterium]